jgi:hypothetical protein
MVLQQQNPAGGQPFAQAPGGTRPKHRLPETYKGKHSGDIILWLEKMDRFLASYTFHSDAADLGCAVTYLAEEAAEYWSNMARRIAGEGREPTMADYRHCLKLQYSDLFRQETAAEEFISLRAERGKHQAFQARWSKLLARLPADPEALKECLLVALYKKALHPSVAARVSVNPTTGSKHTVLKELETAALIAAQTEQSQAGDTQTPGAGKLRDVPVQPARVQPPKRKHQEVAVKLPLEEMECHNCGQKGHLKKQCQLPQAGPSTQGGRGRGRSAPGRFQRGKGRPGR